MHRIDPNSAPARYLAEDLSRGLRTFLTTDYGSGPILMLLANPVEMLVHGRDEPENERDERESPFLFTDALVILSLHEKQGKTTPTDVLSPELGLFPMT